MIYIAHRGNISGINEKLENTTEYIKAAIKKGYKVEIDLWVIDRGRIFLGHDKPQYEIDDDWFLL